MANSRFRQLLCWLLVLSMGHCPLPCFDADWEDRGVPFDSVFDAHAWHTMLLGVATPDDIDRGPFRDDSDDGSPSPYGESYVSTTAVAAPALDGSDSETLVGTSSAVLRIRDDCVTVSRLLLRDLCRTSRHRCALYTLHCVMLV